jgi:hypothetical protein
MQAGHTPCPLQVRVPNQVGIQLTPKRGDTDDVQGHSTGIRSGAAEEEASASARVELTIPVAFEFELPVLNRWWR